MHGMFHAICCKPSKAAAEKATEKASAAAENALSSAQELQKEMASIWQACWPVGPRRYIFFWKGSQENWIIGKPLGRQQLILTGSWPFFARNILQLDFLQGTYVSAIEPWIFFSKQPKDSSQMLKMFLMQIEARGNTTTLSFRENRPTGIPGGTSAFQYNPREPKSGASSGQPKLDSIFWALRKKAVA